MTQISIQRLDPNWSAGTPSKLAVWLPGDLDFPGQLECGHIFTGQEDACGRDPSQSVLWAGISKLLWDLAKASSSDLKSIRDGMLLLLSPVQHVPVLRLEGTTEPKIRAGRLLQPAGV